MQTFYERTWQQRFEIRYHLHEKVDKNERT